MLTGANGIGKSTLLKSILGLIKPLSGDVEQGDYLEIGYFEQETPAGIETTCLEEIWQEFPGYTQYEVRSVLAKCGLTTKHIESMVMGLSGGEQAKVRLCKLINRESNILVLDEPTNHLDVDAKDELKRALMAYKGSILMVCHEPEFYDGLATDVWDCGKWTTRIISLKYSGNIFLIASIFSEYLLICLCDIWAAFSLSFFSMAATSSPWSFRILPVSLHLKLNIVVLSKCGAMLSTRLYHTVLPHILYRLP